MREYTCRECNKSKDIEEFYKDSRLLTGHSRKCIECTKALRKTRKVKDLFYRKKMEKPVPEYVPLEGEALRKAYDEEMAMRKKHSIERVPIAVEKQELPEFDWINFFRRRKFAAIKFCMSRGGGKTTLINHLYPLFRVLYDLVFLYCQSLMGEAYEFLTDEDKELAFDDFVPQIFEEVDQVQRKLGRPLSVIHIMDDCSDDSVIKYNRQILLKHIRGRNSNEAIITSDQSPTFLNKNSRNNIDLLVIGKFITPDMYDTVAKLFMRRAITIPPIYKSKRDEDDYMAEWIRVHTQDHNMIVVDFMDDRKIYQYKVNGELDISGVDF